MTSTRTCRIHPTVLISPSAVVDQTVKIGAYSIIQGTAIISSNVTIGAHCIIGAMPFNDVTDKEFGVTLEEGVWVGDKVHIQNGVRRQTVIARKSLINHGCLIGHDVHIGPSCVIGLASTISGHSNLGEGVKIGPGSTLNNRSEIGENARIGIGSLVLHPVPAHKIFIGRPASDITEQKKMSAMLRVLSGSKRKSMPVTTAAPGLVRYKRIIRPIFNLLPGSLQDIIKRIMIRRKSG